MVWARLRGTPHQQRRDFQSRGSYRRIHHAAAGLAREGNESGDRQVGSGANQRSRTIRARSLARPVASRGGSNRADRQGRWQGAGDAGREQHTGLRRKPCRRRAPKFELRFVPASTDLRQSPAPSLSLLFVAASCLKSHRRMARERIPAAMNASRVIPRAHHSFFAAWSRCDTSLKR